MGCISATMTAQRELHVLKEVQAAQQQAASDLSKFKNEHQQVVTKMREDHFSQVKELNERISKMVEEKTTEHGKIMEAQISETRQLQERHTEEIRRLQDKHHSHMKDELMRHVEEVRRLQAEYRAQLKAVGLDMRYMGGRGCCGPAGVAKKDIVFSGNQMMEPAGEPSVRGPYSPYIQK